MEQIFNFFIKFLLSSKNTINFEKKLKIRTISQLFGIKLEIMNLIHLSFQLSTLVGKIGYSHLMTRERFLPSLQTFSKNLYNGELVLVTKFDNL